MTGRSGLEGVAGPTRSGRTLGVVLVSTLMVLLATLGMAACSSDDSSDTADTTATSEAGATEPGDDGDSSDSTDDSATTGGDSDGTDTTEDGGDGSDPGDLPRYATVEWGDQERTFALVMCENPDASSLLVSGSDDEDYVITFDITGGSGEIFIAAPETLETVFEVVVDGFEVGADGALSAAGTTADGADFDLTGTCGQAPG